MPDTVLIALYILTLRNMPSWNFSFLIFVLHMRMLRQWEVEGLERRHIGSVGGVELGFLPRQAAFRSCAFSHCTVCRNPPLLNTLFLFLDPGGDAGWVLGGLVRMDNNQTDVMMGTYFYDLCTWQNRSWNCRLFFFLVWGSIFRKELFTFWNLCW